MNKRIQRAEELAKAFTNEELLEHSEFWSDMYLEHQSPFDPIRMENCHELMMTYELARSMQELGVNKLWNIKT